MKLIIDRIEGEFAICEKENKHIISIPIKDIPFNVKEGDVLIVEGNAYKLDNEVTKTKKKYIEDLTKDLWK